MYPYRCTYKDPRISAIVAPISTSSLGLRERTMNARYDTISILLLFKLSNGVVSLFLVNI